MLFGIGVFLAFLAATAIPYDPWRGIVLLIGIVFMALHFTSKKSADN
jgi:hypothetical protein